MRWIPRRLKNGEGSTEDDDGGDIGRGRSDRVKTTVADASGHMRRDCRVVEDLAGLCKFFIPGQSSALRRLLSCDRVRVEEEMEELVGVVVDANRLRRSVLADVMSATTVYKATLFLEAAAEFLVGFCDAKLVKEFEECEKAVN
ncbi:glutamyl-tRNA(Gln) amidotransferase subunit A [Striga asiatica]|uniref:Glutamyl-tRNA(Gln) amidotransferase subunit A n=1 Tax=Striga asiatica TaxID=4170 RepID=A0A5A7PHB6_STRAF|nr:glutamyl-tRNA(Gln) amidotransferase subunit A [Striga asiatica]